MSPTAATVGIAHLPNQRHKIAAQKGIHFTLMVCGESGLGKTTFINTLFTTTIKKPKDHSSRYMKQLSKTVNIEITKAELEEKKFQVHLTVVDTPGFGDYVDNYNSWMPIIDFIDDQYETYMRQEQQPQRDELVDMRVHACLYFIRPTGHSLKSLDVEVMKRLCTRVNLIPVIAKADTLTSSQLERFKQQIRNDLDRHHITIYRCPDDMTDELLTEMDAGLMAAMPFALIGSTQEVERADGRRVRGREYSWGVAEVENEDHCDFLKLRQLLIRTHLLDLLESTAEVHYENYRMREMVKAAEHQRRHVQRNRAFEKNVVYKEREEALRREFTEEVKREEARFRSWEAQLVAERDELNRDLERRHAQIRALEAELEALYYHPSGASSSASSSVASSMARH
ncbi:MAG: Septin-domain-containing protein [Benjaminiella poitrasii]|nr:MAG: Septin-domain-containing protein [Benjaminiella poitrasii]